MTSVLYEESAMNGTDFLSVANTAIIGEFDHLRAMAWTDYHTPTVLKLSFAYLASIFAIKYYMRNRQPFDLQTPLIVWNGLQSVFSFLVVYNTFPEALATFKAEGLVGLNCSTNFYKGAAGAWHFAFLLSKVADLVDTYFIVLRKKPLVFLHYYHHIAVIVVGFMMCSRGNAGRLITIINGSIHAIMYAYYCARSMHLKVPGYMARTITRVQIIQFCIGAIVMLHMTAEYFTGTRCHVDGTMVALMSFVNLSFLVLFVNFFRQSYVVAGGKAKYRDPIKRGVCKDVKAE